MGHYGVNEGSFAFPHGLYCTYKMTCCKTKPKLSATELYGTLFITLSVNITPQKLSLLVPTLWLADTSVCIGKNLRHC